MEYQLISPIDENKSVVEQILTNRGIPLKDIPHYLNTTESDNLNPLLLKNMREGAEMLVKHLFSGKIYLIVDSDADGYTSSAIFLNYLHSWIPTIVESQITYDFHDDKAHGIVLEQVPQKTTLVVAIDSSSNDFEIHKQLANQGIDVLILDHHPVSAESTYACVINNQLCDYPTKSLSGAGIAYKFCQYLDTLLNLNYADNYLDLVSCALIADVMDMRDFETSYLTHKGLTQIHNPFLSAMVDKNRIKLGNDLTPIGIAFYVAPYINAITRVGQEEEKRTLFEAMLEWKAYESIPSTKRGCKGQFETIVDQAVRNCTNVKNRQTRTRDQNLEIIEKLIEEQNLLSHKILLIRIPKEKEIDKGLTGLVAMELASKYQKPTLLLNQNNIDGELAWSGSGRGLGSSKLLDFRGFCEKSGFVYLAQGHPQAFGFAILDSQVDNFLSYCEKTLYNMDFTPCYKVDFIFSTQTLKPKNILDIAGMKSLWGQNVGEALIAVEGIRVCASNLYLMSRDKNPTLKITLPNGVACIKFKSNDEEFNELFSESGCVVINLVGKCELNEYNGLITPQIIIENYDIISRQQYYF